MTIFSFLRLTLLLALIASVFTGCSRDPNVRKQKYVQSGQAYYEKGEFAEAAIQFRNAIAVDPSYAAAHFQLAMTYLKTQQWQRANHELARIIDLEPKNYPARVEMAKLLIARGNLQRAQEQADTLLHDRPKRCAIPLYRCKSAGGASSFPCRNPGNAESDHP